MPRTIIPYNPRLKEMARKLRNDSAIGEILLWKELKGKQGRGYDFHRQKPLLNYIVDFYCFELNLIIEIDGQYHNHEETYKLDLIREQELEKYDLTIIRFTELEVRKDMFNVLRTIEQNIEKFKDNEVDHTSYPSQEESRIS
ncbi:endonuclease domain-containing protein [Mucilaginibacter gossypii]|uniref:endonuclease domain-containing protein n=1 Tax=Mucilaginibacter gossypii TaxID=551996 RepID=UPI000DCDD751|nr:endonuclease domain-containing protein [Mucilaginibacter gossypii]QTE37055.1 endonuclease domain-containing protein [Mucilaginibacter gossypii]RAV45625.1 DNA methylase [Mucilaginibacter rubeus]